MNNLDRINPTEIKKYLGTPREAAIWTWQIIDGTLSLDAIQEKIDTLVEKWRQSAPTELKEFTRILCIDQIDFAIVNFEVNINFIFPEIKPPIVEKYLSEMNSIKQLVISQKGTYHRNSYLNEETQIMEYKLWKRIRYKLTSVPWPATDNILTPKNQIDANNILLELASSANEFRKGFDSIKNENQRRNKNADWFINERFNLAKKSEIISNWLSPSKYDKNPKQNEFSIKEFLVQELEVRAQDDVHIDVLLKDWQSRELEMRLGISGIPRKRTIKSEREAAFVIKLGELAKDWQNKNPGGKLNAIPASDIAAIAKILGDFCFENDIPYSIKNLKKRIRRNLNQLILR